jgi:hypothetical protein
LKFLFHRYFRAVASFLPHFFIFFALSFLSQPLGRPPPPPHDRAGAVFVQRDGIGISRGDRVKDLAAGEDLVIGFVGIEDNGAARRERARDGALPGADASEKADAKRWRQRADDAIVVGVGGHAVAVLSTERLPLRMRHVTRVA